MKKEAVLTKIAAPEFKVDFEKNPDKEREDIMTMIESIPDPLRSDAWIYRIVVLALGLTAIIAIIGGIIITMAGETSPDILIALGSAAVGALAGLLAPSPSRSSE
jgi:hypothetical protein